MADKTPKQIWAFAPDIFDNVSLWQDQPPPEGDAIEYLRADVAQAMVAAAYEAAKEVAANRVAVCEDEERRDRDGIGASCRLEADLILRRIHAMIPDDARAALDAMLAEEREKALREAAAAIPLPETGNAGPPQDATDRLLDAQRRSDKEAILALIDKPADPGAP